MIIERGLLALAAATLAAHGAAAAAAPTKLAISYSQQTGDALPLWVALDGGYFAAHGLDVELKLLPAQQGVPALLAGDVQAVSIGAADSLAAVAQGVKLKYVAANAPLFEMQLWSRPDVRSAEQLKGKKVGLPSTTGTAYVETIIALRDLGLKPSDVALTPIGSSQNLYGALYAGSISAGVSTPPTTYAFKQHGFVLLLDLEKKPVPSVTTGIAVLDSYIPSHRALLQQAVDAFAEGLRREKTDKAFTEAEIRKYLRISDQAGLDQSYDFYRRTIVQDLPMPDKSGFAAAQSVIGATNPKVKAVDLASMIDQSFVKEAAVELDGKR